MLVDTGVGGDGVPGATWIGTPGRLPEELAAAGVEPDEIDLVVLTHLHLDHIGWNLAWDGDRPRPRFPRARYLVQRADWELFAARGDEEDRVAFDRCVAPLQSLGVAELLDGDRVLDDQLSLVHTPGHTPGSQSLLVRSGDDAALLWGDVANHPAQVGEPDWGPGSDVQPEVARGTRRRLLDQHRERGHVARPGPLPRAVRHRDPGRGRPPLAGPPVTAGPAASQAGAPVVVGAGERRKSAVMESPGQAAARCFRCGGVAVSRPSGSRASRQPPSWTARWWARHSRARLSRSVGPPCSQWRRWWASHQAGGRSQPATAQPPSRTTRAARWAAGDDPAGPAHLQRLGGGAAQGRGEPASPLPGAGPPGRPRRRGRAVGRRGRGRRVAGGVGWRLTRTRVTRAVAGQPPAGLGVQRPGPAGLAAQPTGVAEAGCPGPR